MTARFPNVTELLPDEKEHRRQIAKAVNRVNQGKMNVTITVTLNPNSTTTIIRDARIGAFSAISPAMATTADAAIAISSGVYVNNISNGQATINHASSAHTDQTIVFTILG